MSDSSRASANEVNTGQRMPTERIVLTGPPGSGKSTVGAALAEQLNWPLRDTDADIVSEAKQPIADIFVEHGEAYFRKLEELAVARALAEHRGVLSLGGGAVLAPATRDLLANEFVVFLDVGLSAASRRIGFDTAGVRPLLLGNPRSLWKKLMQERRPIYEAVATITVVTDELTPAEIAKEIIRKWSNGQG